MHYQEMLKQAGLTDAQAEVYEVLLRHGEQTAGSLTKKTSLKRGLVYKVLDDLVGLGLAAKQEELGKVAHFFPKHPAVLRELVNRRQKTLKDAELVLDGLLPSLVSEYNLVSGSPGVLIYEGKEGIEKVLNDSLTSKTIVYTYADIEPIVKHIDAINRRYADKRDKLGIDKKAILLDTPFARKYMQDYHRLSTDIRLIALENVPPFQSAMEIYDNKVAYITFAEDKMLGVIIHDPYLYQMHKYLFEYTWNQARALDGTVTISASETSDKDESHKSDDITPLEDEPVGEDEYFTRL